jgi:chromosome segregation ATPase
MPRPVRPDADIDQLVFPVAQRLFAAEQDPQARAIGRILREDQGQAIGQNHIQRALDRWRQTERRPKTLAPTEPLSPELARVLLDWAAHERATARADLELEAAVLKTEKDDLLVACDRRDEECAALTEQVETLTRERDTMMGQLTEVTTERDRLTQELERERKSVETLRVQVAEGTLAATQHTTELIALRTERERLLGDLHTERQARIDAQRELAAFTAERDAMAEHVSDLQRRESTAVEAVTALRQQTQTLTERLLEADAQRARAEASLERADTQIADLRDGVKLAREEQEKLARDNARLDEQLRSVSSTR